MDKLINICILLCFISFILLIVYTFKLQTTGNISSVDTIVQKDTICDTIQMIKYKPQIKAVHTLKTDTVISSKGDTIKLITEQKKYADTLISEGDTAYVNTYISGINSSLDSLFINLHKRNVNTNTIITKTKEKRKGFYFSPQVGIGYGLFNNKIDMYIGVGIGYGF